VPTLPGEYGPAEDVHMILDHLIVSFLWEWSVAQAEQLKAAKPTSV
jgi:hypothetical protein